MKPPAIISPDYAAFLLADVRGRIASARLSAARAVNRELILLWDIGHGIVEKQQALGWGESVVERLATDLQAAFPEMQGFSGRNLRDMRRLYLAYSDKEFWRQAVAKMKPAREGDVIWRQPVAKLDRAFLYFGDLLHAKVREFNPKHTEALP